MMNERSDLYGVEKKASPKKGCIKGVTFDYKKPDELRRYINEFGRIRPRRQTGLCAKEQRSLAQAVKWARHLALLPFVEE
jgi:small subunit ribosomal protein S18